MNRRNFLKTTAGFAAAGMVTQISTMRSAAAGEAIKVGVLVPLSGPAGLFGPSSKNCSDLAVAQINAAGGILGRYIEPVYIDAGAPIADVTQSVLKLWKGGKAEAFIGMHDSALRGALVNLFKGQVPYIYTAAYEGGACGPGLYVIGETPKTTTPPRHPLSRHREECLQVVPDRQRLQLAAGHQYRRQSLHQCERRNGRG